MKYRSQLLVALAIMMYCQALLAADRPSGTRVWLDRPWEIRYVLFVEEAWRMQSEITAGLKSNLEKAAPGNRNVYLHAAELFAPTIKLAVPGSETVAVVLLRFDRLGHVITKNRSLQKMTAKRNLLDDLVLIRDESPGGKPYYFADWSQGIPGDVGFSPAVCTLQDMRRYQDGWNIDGYSGNFGCREWTAQLYDRTAPYIDVTTYASHGNFIGEFVGWSRFEDPPKPVIGQQQQVWLCLHECPAGEKPGVIPDIKAWTRRHGYPMPERPPKQPLYPNADFQDDLNE